MDFHIDTTFSANQHNVAALLGSGLTVAETARQMRMSSRTIYGWMQDPRYKSYVNRVRGTVMRESLSTVVKVTRKALDKLDKLLDSEDETVVDKAVGRALDASFKMDERFNIDEETHDARGYHGIPGGVTPDTQGTGEAGHGSGDTSGRPVAGLSPDDPFADVLPVIKSNDGDDSMVTNLRESSADCGGPRRKRHAKRYRTLQGGHGANGHSNGHAGGNGHSGGSNGQSP